MLRKTALCLRIDEFCLREIGWNFYLTFPFQESEEFKDVQDRSRFTGFRNKSFSDFSNTMPRISGRKDLKKDQSGLIFRTFLWFWIILKKILPKIGWISPPRILWNSNMFPPGHTWTRFVFAPVFTRFGRRGSFLEDFLSHKLKGSDQDRRSFCFPGFLVWLMCFFLNLIFY